MKTKQKVGFTLHACGNVRGAVPAPSDLVFGETVSVDIPNDWAKYLGDDPSISIIVTPVGDVRCLSIAYQNSTKFEVRADENESSTSVSFNWAAIGNKAA